MMRHRKSDHNIIVEFDAEVYSEQAVKSAIYDLDIPTQISIRGQINRTIQVKVQSSMEGAAVIEKKICRAVLDHQIRIDVQKEFGPYRKLILAQAFFPCENLDQILDEMDL